MRCILVLLGTLASLSLSASQLYLEIPVGMKTKHSAALSNKMLSSFGLGFTHFVIEKASFNIGFGAAISFFPQSNDGTDLVYSSVREFELEAKAILSTSLVGTAFTISPYAMLSPHLGIQCSTLIVYESNSTLCKIEPGCRGGVGVEVRLFDWSAKLEGGAGVASYGFNFRAVIILGLGIF